MGYSGIISSSAGRNYPELIRSAVRAGLIAAFVAAMMLTANQFETFRDCHGAFSRAFSNGFDRYRCDLGIRHVVTSYELMLPIPDLTADNFYVETNQLN